MSSIALKAIHVMPSLLLQEPSSVSKSKDHVKVLERRLELWYRGEIKELLFETETIQERLKSTNKTKNIAQLSKQFVILMAKGNINGALKLLSNNMSNGILPLNDETLQLLQQKHQDAQQVSEDTLLQGNIPEVHPVLFEEIDDEMVKQAAIKTKGGSGPSGMGADGWQRILASNNFGSASQDLRKAFAEMIKKICTQKIETENDATALEAFLACRLIPLDKNPGLRPIGVGEVLHRIAGKVVMKVLKEDVRNSAGGLQLCAGHEAGAEAAIHAMHEVFKSNVTSRCR